MTAYARYTEFTYAAESQAQIAEFWANPETPNGQDREGFRQSFVFDSVEQPGTLRVLSVWDSAAPFDDYYATPKHDHILERLDELGAVRSVRDGLELRREVQPHAGHIRIIRSALHSADVIDDLGEFWRSEGRAFIEAAPGAIRARAYVQPDDLLFIIQVWWRSEEEATTFVSSPEHDDFLGAQLRQWTTRTDRADLTPLD